MTPAPTPFTFIGCLELREMLGRTAWDERDLLVGIEEVPQDSIHYHTHGAFLRSRYLQAPYPNDFATWAAIQLRDRVLGERLAVVDPFDYSDVEQLRAELVTIVDDHLSPLQTIPRIVYGEPFYFMRSTLIEIPTKISVTTLQEFRDGLTRADLSVIYYHFLEPRRRRRREADPAAWIERELQLAGLADRLRRLNPYVSTLEGMRAQLVALCTRAMEGVPNA